MHEELVKLEGDQWYIHTTSARIDDRTRVLKHGDTFAVFDRFGEIDGLHEAQYGIFHHDTRFLSRLAIRLEHRRLMLLSSAIKEDEALLTIDMTNTDVEHAREVVIPHGSLHVFRSIVLWNATCHERMRIHNYGRSTVRFALRVRFDADFADIFEVRGHKRAHRGRRLPARVDGDALELAYEGLDGRTRRTRIRFDPAPSSLDSSEAAFELELVPQGAATLRFSILCESERGAGRGERLAASGGDGRPRDYEEAAKVATLSRSAACESEPSLVTSSSRFNTWWNRSLADLHILQTETPQGLYPYAGIPWFSTPFGRDGLLTALSTLWFSPALARGVLSYLAATQADEDDPEQDAQPGKILHETRGGEMAALGEVPFARYYGSVDATPLFVVLAGAHDERTGDTRFLRGLWPHVERALDWIDRSGDADGDGFVEYARRSEHGLVQQGWKDSHDSVFHADGTPAEGPIALCEVQGYVYAARLAAARLARRLGLEARAGELETQARRLRQRFDEAFWSDDLSSYALALDGSKRPCLVRASNAGHCLFTGIAGEDRVQRLAETLFSEPSFSGWGIRTLASTEPAYNPMSYHNGSVWPHDNALIAAGFGRYGLRSLAGRIMDGLLDASTFFELHRLPELFCGFARRAGESPTLYPTACSPQAWAAATPWPCLQACLGLEVLGSGRRISFRNPWLPEYLHEIRIEGLCVGEGSVDLLVTRHDHDVSVSLLRRAGEVEVAVLK